MISFTKTGSTWTSNIDDNWLDVDTTDNLALKWFRDNYLTFLDSTEDAEIIVENSEKTIIYIDWSNFETADDGDTTHYGGKVNVKIVLPNGTEFDEEFRGWGDDRSDSTHTKIADLIEKYLDGRSLKIIQSTWPHAKPVKIKIDKNLLVQLINRADYWCSRIGDVNDRKLIDRVNAEIDTAY